ncbi:hypothetical protein BFP76_05070 [Amylibacter kogurei]|uniref:Uncharacterized protein n=1 Tax=Paramylibacter kogurei TaxID=1889778 RepID=A0A2G5K574_9RHOB|nr:hypothetical protein BFP76_05070 [Amylibacter kogurei]
MPFILFPAGQQDVSKSYQPKNQEQKFGNQITFRFPLLCKIYALSFPWLINGATKGSTKRRDFSVATNSIFLNLFFETLEPCPILTDAFQKRSNNWLTNVDRFQV